MPDDLEKPLNAEATPEKNDSKFGGAYLTPVTYVSETYSTANFYEIEFWERERHSWGQVAFSVQHRSRLRRRAEEKVDTIEYVAQVLLSKDGLLAAELRQGAAESDAHALRVMSIHLNSFLSVLNLGGFYFSPISEKEINHIAFEADTIALTGGGGDAYSMTTLDRATERFVTPARSGFIMPKVGLQVLSPREIQDAYALGREVADKLSLADDELSLMLLAYDHFSKHRWSAALLLGWTFCEILIDRIWKEKVIGPATRTDGPDRGRRLAGTVYTAAIRLEFLYQGGILTQDAYTTLSRIRTLRNDFMHRGIDVGPREASDITPVFRFLIGVASGVEPNVKGMGWTRAGGWVESKIEAAKPTQSAPEETSGDMVVVLVKSCPVRLVDLLVLGGLLPSKQQARKRIQGGAIRIDGQKYTDPTFELTSDAFTDSGIVVQVGKQAQNRRLYKLAAGTEDESG